jgi:putative resolvase
VNLTEWTHAQGIHVAIAYRWYREGTLPVPARKVGRLILVSPDTAALSPAQSGAGLYARVSSHDQKADLDRQAARLSVWAAQAGLPLPLPLPLVRVEAEVGSGMNGSRPRARRLPAGSDVSVVVVEHRDRLGRMNTELAEAALAAHHRRLAVLEESEVTDDLVRDMIEVLTLFCARLYGRWSAPNRALKAVGCAQRDIGPRAVLAAGSTPCGGAG